MDLSHVDEVLEEFSLLDLQRPALAPAHEETHEEARGKGHT